MELTLVTKKKHDPVNDLSLILILIFCILSCCLKKSQKRRKVYQMKK